jgi:anti-sigma-K factor RskA
VNEQDIISSGVLELYVMGITSPEETRNVEAWAKQYPLVAAEIAAIEATMQNYAQANAIAPAATVKENILKAIQTDTVSGIKKVAAAEAKIYSISPFWKYAAAASIILLIGSAILNYSYYTKYQTANTELETAQTELQKQKELDESMHIDMGVMTNKNAMPVSLKGMPDVPDAAARIYWMQDTHEVYIDPSNLPQAPAGKQYQFWAIVDGVPVSGGMITTLKDGKTVHVQRMKSFGNAQAFAVSLEDAGPEKPAPSHVYVMGKM